MSACLATVYRIRFVERHAVRILSGDLGNKPRIVEGRATTACSVVELKDLSWTINRNGD